jgi:hypothetical protein
MVIVIFGNAFMLSITSFVLMMKFSYIDYLDGYGCIMLKYVDFVILCDDDEVELVLVDIPIFFSVIDKGDCILNS